MASRNSHWDAPQLAELMGAEADDLPAVAKSLDKPYGSCLAVRRQIKEARKARRNCPAFLPDDGVPYAVRMMKVHQG